MELREELLPGAFALSDAVIHNQSVVTGSGPMDITTPADQWAFAVSFPLRSEACGRAGKELLCVTVEAEVKSGRIGIGCVAPDYSTYVSTESDRTPRDGNTVYDVFIERPRGDGCGWLVVRNTAEGGAPSRVVIRSIRTFRTGATRIPDLVEVETPDIPEVPLETASGSGNSALDDARTRRFQLLLTHTSRSWDWTRCSRDFIAQRAADPNRLRNLPLFETLPPCQDPSLQRRTQRTGSGG